MLLNFVHRPAHDVARAAPASFQATSFAPA